ncbi:hypothetical protein NRB20_40400 [Nocardia sp. RB20]|uniref:Uncharacterized protein n=1 Tax=Nocardia macrotermitis TaxID=2585198 RepID=A0A7K0D5U6_9NOCA|nr:hypothetical protein [Nocardia macrotermitis]
MRRTEAHGSSVASWKMKATDGVPTATAPEDGRSSPAARRSSVDLPQPEGPTTATNSPRRTDSDTEDSAVVPVG